MTSALKERWYPETEKHNNTKEQCTVELYNYIILLKYFKQHFCLLQLVFTPIFLVR